MTTSRPSAAAIGLHADTAAQIVQQQCLLSSRAPVPRNTSVLIELNGDAPCRAISADQDHISMGFSTSGRDRPNAHFRHEFHGDAACG